MAIQRGQQLDESAESVRCMQNIAENSIDTKTDRLIRFY